MERLHAEVEDPNQTPVDPDQQVKAFNYGKQLVPVPKQQEEKLKGEETQSQLKMLGFAMVDSIPRHHFLGSVDVVVGVNSVKNQRAFTAIVRAMIELKRVLIAKIVERKNAQPKLVSLWPHISKGRAILYMAQLPTAEDIRDYQFPSLVSATAEQEKVTGELVTALTLDED